MRPLRNLALYIVSVFVGAALLAPAVYQFAQWSAAHGAALEWLAHQPFHRYVNRCLLGLGLIGLWPFLRSIGVTSWQRAGLVRGPRAWRELALGLAVGLASLAVVVVILHAVGARAWRTPESAGQLATALGGAALTALTVAVMEELLFRGALFGALVRVHHWSLALLASSAFYALMHFFQRPAPPAEVHWFTGFTTLGSMMRGFLDLGALVPTFFTLALAGMILGLAYHRSGSLFFPIGLHAGWVFWMKSLRLISTAQPAGPHGLWDKGRLADGWTALAILGCLFAALALLPASQRSPVAPCDSRK